jgi:SAM-dependent methyltransferase
MGPRWLFASVITDAKFDEVLGVLEPRPGAPGSRTAPPRWRRAIRRLRPWFWPYIADAEPWASASEEHWYAPSVYIIEDPGPLLVRLLETTPREHSVLDLGCNSGANLNFLREAGFTGLSGVDAGREALRLFASRFPETYELAQPRHDLFQRHLLRSPDRSVDVIHSNGATLELVHPSFPIVSEICRVARDAVFLDIQERGHAYPRKYIEEFKRHGFLLVYCDRPDDLVNGSSILHFRRIR